MFLPHSSDFYSVRLRLPMFLGNMILTICLIVRCDMFTSEAFSRYENFVMKRLFIVLAESLSGIMIQRKERESLRSVSNSASSGLFIILFNSASIEFFNKGACKRDQKQLHARCMHISIRIFFLSSENYLVSIQ